MTTLHPRTALAHVRHWVFDLDNTLYPPEARLFDQIEVRMTEWMMRTLSVSRPEANRLRRAYWELYGTTLAGLMAEHGQDPEEYMLDVHDITLDHLTRDDVLARRIRALPGRRIVFTNGSAPYAERVLEARGLAGCFDAVFGVEHAAYTPKPQAAAFRRVFDAAGLDTATGAMFEDDPRNLAAPRRMGLKTVHVAPTRETADHIDFHTDDLTAFLGTLGHAP
ncbi:pyrimidine 5'-nucleotidase [Oceaniglobus indicus]|uniref:pyrimidine 5'-nucleotidase n=1 Tax=Oceaniglobus indicus TaxID=2047749 RepID=UPI000C18C0CE|nr:pyrimidine 5'-nucleotidase [Oceaniglobus indicus]